MDNFCYGVAMCSGRKFCSEHFCAHFRLHWAWTDQSDLGITGKIFSFYRSIDDAILVKVDDVKSWTKAKAHRGQLWESIHLIHKWPPTWDERTTKHGIEAFWDKNLFSCKLWPINKVLQQHRKTQLMERDVLSVLIVLLLRWFVYIA